MLELNKVLLVGNLVRDPELKSLPSGVSLASMTIAVNRRTRDKDKDETVFVDVAAWEKLADFCKNYLAKGKAVFVEGRLKQDKWEDKQTGQTRTKLSVVAERVQFADSKGSAETAPEASAPAPSPEPQPKPNPKPAGNTEDDLPF